MTAIGIHQVPRASTSLTLPPLANGAIQLLIICWIFTPLAIIAVGLRLWARQVKRQKLVFNDWAIIAALTANCGQTALLTYACAAAGIGHHLSDLTEHWPDTIPRLLKCYVAAEPLWMATNSLIKISILDFYVKVFSTSRTFKNICYGMMALVGAFWVSTFVRSFFLCKPLEALWNPTLLATVPGAYCLDLRAVYLSVSIINQIIDFTMVMLPWPLIWRLRLPLKKKLMLTGVFGLGFFICAVTGLRIKAVLDLDLTDVSYTVTPDGIWSTLEPCLGIVNACLPLLQPLGQRLNQRMPWSTQRGHTGHSGSTRVANTLPYQASGIRSQMASSHTSKRDRSFVPLTDDAWDNDSTDAKWMVEAQPALPLETVQKPDPKHCSNVDDLEANSIQVTREWSIQHK